VRLYRRPWTRRKGMELSLSSFERWLTGKWCDFTHVASYLGRKGRREEREKANDHFLGRSQSAFDRSR
jgi:hypothetical protein